MHLVLLLPAGCAKKTCKPLSGRCCYGETGRGRWGGQGQEGGEGAVSLTGAQGRGENQQNPPGSESLRVPEVPGVQCLGNPIISDSSSILAHVGSSSSLIDTMFCLPWGF